MSLGYGGPVIAAASLHAALVRAGHHSEILCLGPPGEDDVYCDGVEHVGSKTGLYGFSLAAIRQLKSRASEFDGVIVHGIWQFQTVLARLVLTSLRVPYLVFVHGALDPWFRKAYPLKHVKKSVYWRTIERRNLLAAKAVLFTSEDESCLAAADFNLSEIQARVIPFGISDPALQLASSAASEKRQEFLLFMSRLHLKKGLENLIAAFSDLHRSNSSLKLVIAGRGEASYGRKLAALAQSLGCAEAIEWVGQVVGAEKIRLLERASALVLPSHSENFGIVVAEALAFGLPVIISNRVNIWKDIEIWKCGLIVNPTHQSTRDGIETWLKMSRFERELMGVRARNCFEAKFEIGNTVRSLIDIFTRSLEA